MKKNFNSKFWKKKKVFILVHTGFKGSWLCLVLNSLGSEITGYSVKPKPQPSLYELAGIKKIVKKSIIAYSLATRVRVLVSRAWRRSRGRPRFRRLQ